MKRSTFIFSFLRFLIIVIEKKRVKKFSQGIFPGISLYLSQKLSDFPKPIPTKPLSPNISPKDSEIPKFGRSPQIW